MLVVKAHLFRVNHKSRKGLFLFAGNLIIIRPIAENKVVVKRLVYALTDELRTDYQQCMEQAAAWSKYVIPRILVLTVRK